MENLLLKTPYKFKKSYGGTPEPQTPQDAPWLRGPSLRKFLNINLCIGAGAVFGKVTRYENSGSYSSTI
jgi:hypothetical protein